MFSTWWKDSRLAARRDIGLLTPVDSMTQITAVDTIVCGKTILCFSFLFISTLILGLRVWNQVDWWKDTVSGGGRAKRKERGRECANEYFGQFWMSRDTDSFSLFLFVFPGLCLSLVPSRNTSISLFDSFSSPERIFYEVQYTLSSRWID